MQNPQIRYIEFQFGVDLPQAWPWRAVTMAIAAAVVLWFFSSLPAWAGAQVNGTGEVFQYYHIGTDAHFMANCGYSPQRESSACNPPDASLGKDCYGRDIWVSGWGSWLLALPSSPLPHSIVNGEPFGWWYQYYVAVNIGDRCQYWNMYVNWYNNGGPLIESPVVLVVMPTKDDPQMDDKRLRVRDGPPGSDTKLVTLVYGGLRAGQTVTITIDHAVNSDVAGLGGRTLGPWTGLDIRTATAGQDGVARFTDIPIQTSDTKGYVRTSADIRPGGDTNVMVGQPDTGLANCDGNCPIDHTSYRRGGQPY